MNISNVTHEIYSALKEQCRIPPVMKNGVIKVPGYGYIIEAKTETSHPDLFGAGIAFISEKGAAILNTWSKLMVRADYKQEGVNLITTENTVDFINITRWVAPNSMFDDAGLGPQEVELSMIIDQDGRATYTASISQYDYTDSVLFRRNLSFDDPIKYASELEDVFVEHDSNYSVDDSSEIMDALRQGHAIDQIVDLSSRYLPEVIKDSINTAMHTIAESVLNNDQTRGPR